MSVHDRWNGARTGDGRRWEVRWRDAGKQRKRRFTSKHAALTWDATVQLRPGEGRPSITVAELHPAWEKSKQSLAVTTRHRYKDVWARYVEPEWGHAPVDKVRAGAIQTWIGELQAESPSQARQALAVLSGILRHAALDGHIDANPCSAVRWPEIQRAEVVPLDLEQITKLAAACAPHELFVWTLATLGPRFGEAAGLRVGDLDVKRARIRVARSITTVGTDLVESAPKSGKGRDLPVPAWLLDALAAHVEGRGRDEPMFPTEAGGVWRQSSWKRVWRGEKGRPGRAARPGALQKAGLPLSTRVHDLRHTAAVRMLEAGTPARTVQRILGHASLMMTLDLYGRWERSDLDAAATLWDGPDAPLV